MLPTSVAADGIGRYAQDVEAAVYFCCLEALQNAGKHAGDGAEITVEVTASDGELRFCVADDGAGFDLADRSGGHGFVEHGRPPRRHRRLGRGVVGARPGHPHRRSPARRAP